MSTDAGIPDFRSPDTGLYANLARLELPYPEAVFDISFFRNNPLPFYTLAHDLYPGKYRPTISHSFVRLLSDKGLLLKLFTQNIDCLDREAGVPEDKIIEAHGSFAHNHCIECRSSFSDDLMRQAVSKRDIPHCLTPQCNGLVKPDIIFFGEQLPEEFHRNRSLPSSADLCIVMGTSLTVQPFASLPGFCSEGVPRVLINLERVGGLGSRPDDVLLLGNCDAGVRRLAAALGWEKDLETLWESTAHGIPTTDGDLKVTQRDKAELLDDQITNLTQEVEQSLKISHDHTARLRQHLALNEEDTKLSNGTTTLEKPVTRDNSEAEVPRGTDTRPTSKETSQVSSAASGEISLVTTPSGLEKYSS